MSKEGGAAVVGIAGVAVCAPLVIAGGALALAAYLAIKGTCLAAKGMFLLGKEAHGAVKRHQEEKKRQRLDALAAERAIRETALQAERQLSASQMQAVEQRLAHSRATQQLEAARAAMAAQHKAATLERLTRDAEALAREATLKRQELATLRAKGVQERARWEAQYLRSLEEERKKLERSRLALLREKLSQPVQAEPERLVARTLVAEASRLLRGISTAPDELQAKLTALQAQQQTGAFAELIPQAEALIREIYHHQTQQQLSRMGDYDARIQAHAQYQQARVRLLTEESLPNRRVAEWTERLREAEKLLEQGQYPRATQLSAQIIEAIERHCAGREAEALSAQKRRAEEVLAEARAAVEALTDDEGLMQILGALQQTSAVTALTRELERATRTWDEGEYAQASQRCQAVVAQAEELANRAVAQFVQSQRDTIVAAAEDVMHEMGYGHCTRTPIGGSEGTLMLIGYKGEMPFRISVDLEARIGVHLGHERFPDQLACSRELDLFFQHMRERGIVLNRGDIANTYPLPAGSAQAEPVPVLQDTLMREFEQILADMGVGYYQTERTPEGVQFTAFFGGKAIHASIDHAGTTVADEWGRPMSLEQMREELQAEQQRAAEGVSHDRVQ